MNPLHWKREHRIAIVTSGFVGAVLGWLYGWHVVPSPDEFYAYSYWCPDRLDDFGCHLFRPQWWIDMAAWALLGAGLLAALIYIWRLMRE